MSESFFFKKKEISGFYHGCFLYAFLMDLAFTIRLYYTNKSVFSFQLDMYFFFYFEQPQGRSALNAHGMSFSLQTSPTHSPRCMDPIDFTNLASSRYSSKEDLSFSSLPPYQGNGLSSKWRSSRRSLSGSRDEMYESMEAQSEKLLDERESELRKRLQNFEDGNAK